MGFLTDYVTKSQRRWQNTYVPEWMPAARWGVAALAGIVLLFSILTSLASQDEPTAAVVGDTVPSESLGAFPAPSSELPAPVSSETLVPVNPSTPATATGDTVVVPAIDGGAPVEVSAEAIAVARAAVRGILTADFSRVPVASGSQLPAVPQPLPQARVGDVVGVQEIDGTLTFSVNVDPDGRGATQPYPVAVRVALSGGSYVFVPQ